eukprot:3049389-Rhodomonas_salina.1
MISGHHRGRRETKAAGLKEVPDREFRDRGVGKYLTQDLPPVVLVGLLVVLVVVESYPPGTRVPRYLGSRGTPASWFSVVTSSRCSLLLVPG